MGHNTVPKQPAGVGGFTLTELLIVLAILTVLSAVFFPVFQRGRYPANGAVRDGSGHPLPGAVLRFRNPAGRVVATIAADESGDFRRAGLDALSHNAVDDFGLTRMNRRTGASTLYTFTPLGTHVATFRDASGKAVPGLAVFLTPKYYAWHLGFDESFETVSDKNGIVRVPNVPVGGRFWFYSQDPNYVIGRTQVTVDGNIIRYTVAVTSPTAATSSLRADATEQTPHAH